MRHRIFRYLSHKRPFYCSVANRPMPDTPTEPFDLLIIGGGINGVGIARDAAGRGLRVALCEKGDLGGATSSSSSKLIHGGLRYLEHYEFRLVREALAEREVLLRIAPHIVRPMRFIMPHVPELRPAWMIRIGLFLYDRLSRRVTLPASRGVDLGTEACGAALKPDFRRGFAYSDCWVDDARLVVLNAMDAAQHGARILTRTRFTTATPDGNGWRARVESTADGRSSELRARAIVNAAGPWLATTLDRVPGAEQRHRIQLVKGSHIVVPRLYTGDHAMILQNDDERVVFVIPFEDGYSLIGTTDVAVSGVNAAATISDDEVDYLCRAVNRYLATRCAPGDVVWSYAGVRPLFDDGASSASEISRDYALELDRHDDRPPLLSVYGGKLTTYRKLAETVLEMLVPLLPAAGPAWTADRPLPGGALPGGGVDAVFAALRTDYPDLDDALLGALVRRHGSLAGDVLAGTSGGRDTGPRFGADLYAFEVDYFIRREWAQSAEDVLWRRTKSGLGLDEDGRRAVADYLETHGPVRG
jgi:glycerol-3-phosphate dehydrogenase